MLLKRSTSYEPYAFVELSFSFLACLSLCLSKMSQYLLYTLINTFIFSEMMRKVAYFTTIEQTDKVIFGIDVKAISPS